MVLELGEGRDEDLSVGVGERVEIRLTSPGTTGFLWQLDTDETMCRVVSRDLIPDTEAFGGPGTASFVVEPLRPGTTDVQLRLQAPWQDRPAREHRVRLNVAAAEAAGDVDS